MPNDAKLGLIVGVGVVVAVAVVFFRREPVTAHSLHDDRPVPAATAGMTALPGRNQYRAIPAKKASRGEDEPEVHRHTVQEGDTLFSLAEHYYGDSQKFVEIYRANQEILKTPDHLPEGTALIIHNLP